ncbi:hypothetical protein FKW77_003783 [Venturia effusa]|uniref:Extracellular membrane protein CFEM domain-containing protein n=1 Tax=Venturia effusa TaxID=50376 RepID=A0A517LIG4_9PEZI|nr:hypothetical protein FKW77_003783 [Venturia effusa]
MYYLSAIAVAALIGASSVNGSKCYPREDRDLPWIACERISADVAKVPVFIWSPETKSCCKNGCFDTDNRCWLDQSIPNYKPDFIACMYNSPKRAKLALFEKFDAWGFCTNQ